MMMSDVYRLWHVEIIIELQLTTLFYSSYIVHHIVTSNNSRVLLDSQELNAASGVRYYLICSVFFWRIDLL